MPLQFVEMVAIKITIIRDLTSCNVIEILQNVYTKPHEEDDNPCLQSYLEFLTIRGSTKYLDVCDLLKLLLCIKSYVCPDFSDKEENHLITNCPVDLCQVSLQHL